MRPIYIYTIIAIPLHFLQASSAFDLLFHCSARPFYTIVHIVESRFAVARDVDYPVLIPSRTMVRFAREIEVIVRVRVRLFGNVCLTQNA